VMIWLPFGKSRPDPDPVCCWGKFDKVLDHSRRSRGVDFPDFVYDTP
jgi:hypothetical protein